jgi:hypothetical protein
MSFVQYVRNAHGREGVEVQLDGISWLWELTVRADSEAVLRRVSYYVISLVQCRL